MWKFTGIWVVILFMLVGCASGPQQPPPMNSDILENKPRVVFTGDVKAQVIPHVEGMTLAQGLLMAQYTGYLDPRSITVNRAGIPYKVDVRRFLRGEENPELQAGDTVDVRR